MTELLQILFVVFWWLYFIFEGFTESETWYMAYSALEKEQVTNRTYKYHILRLFEMWGMTLAVAIAFLCDCSTLEFLFLIVGTGLSGLSLYNATNIFYYIWVKVKEHTGIYWIDLLIARLWYKPYPYHIWKWEIPAFGRWYYAGRFIIGIVLIVISVKGIR